MTAALAICLSFALAFAVDRHLGYRAATKRADELHELAAQEAARCVRLHRQLGDARDVNDRLVRRLSGQPASDFPEDAA